MSAGQSPRAPAALQVHYNLFLGANLKMFSSAKAEQHLKNMHEPNHRELAISKFAARVADLLWPGCQDNVDEAIAKHKQMVSKSRVHVPEPEYVPPSVPHLLPVTNWCAHLVLSLVAFVSSVLMAQYCPAAAPQKFGTGSNLGLLEVLPCPI
jgi:hypothetical protein